MISVTKCVHHAAGKHGQAFPNGHGRVAQLGEEAGFFLGFNGGFGMAGIVFPRLKDAFVFPQRAAEAPRELLIGHVGILRTMQSRGQLIVGHIIVLRVGGAEFLKVQHVHSLQLRGRVNGKEKGRKGEVGKNKGESS